MKSSALSEIYDCVKHGIKGKITRSAADFYDKVLWPVAGKFYEKWISIFNTRSIKRH